MATFLRWQFLSKICFASFTTRYLLESNNRRRSQQRRSIIDGSPFKKKKENIKETRLVRGRKLVGYCFPDRSCRRCSPHRQLIHSFPIIYTSAEQSYIILHFGVFSFIFTIAIGINYKHVRWITFSRFYFLFVSSFFFFPPHRCNKIRFRLFLFLLFFFLSVKKSFNVVIVVRVYVVIHCRHYDIRENVLLFDGKEKKNRFDRIEFIAHFRLARIRTYIYIYIYTYTLQKESYLHATQWHDTTRIPNLIELKQTVDNAATMQLFSLFSLLFLLSLTLDPFPI